MDIEKLAERCMVAESCLPDAPYRTQLCKLHQEMLGEIARLRAEVEANRVDAERLDYLQSLSNPQKYMVCVATNPMQKSLRSAIDAARGKDND
jgi:hypothetical protein